MALPKMAFTMGDPAGIGLEIIVRMTEAHSEYAQRAELLIYGIPEIIEKVIKRFCSQVILNYWQEFVRLKILP